jgi:hypothetical protein
MSKPNETRTQLQADLRMVTGDDGQPQIVGYAAVFDQASTDLGGFVEYIQPGAFADVLATQPDVRALWNHDPNFVLGRTTSGTLQLVEDDHGLHMTITPPSTQWARDLLVSIQRGDVSQSSFAFRVAADGETWHHSQRGLPARTIVRVAELSDVSPVTYPAYSSTHVDVRAIEIAQRMAADDDGAPDGAHQDDAAGAAIQDDAADRDQVITDTQRSRFDLYKTITENRS